MKLILSALLLFLTDTPSYLGKATGLICDGVKKRTIINEERCLDNFH